MGYIKNSWKISNTSKKETLENQENKGLGDDDQWKKKKWKLKRKLGKNMKS
jgi:hypothetical protein